MNYKEFEEIIIERLNESYSDKTIVSKEVLKNNDSKKMAISIESEGDNVAPIIYLDEHYKRLTEGESIDNIIQSIKNMIENSKPSFESVFDIESLMDWEKSKELVFPILISQERNKQLLENHPYTEYLDLAVIYIRKIEDDTDGLATVKVTHTLLSEWDITIEELHHQALTNLCNEEFEVKDLTDIVCELVGQDEDTLLDGIEEKSRMMIIMNHSKLYAAASVLNEKFMKERFDGNFYMIPSSIHEWLVVPESSDVSVEQLNQIISEVNSTQVADDEILSDHAYYYENGVGLRMCA